MRPWFGVGSRRLRPPAVRIGAHRTMCHRRCASKKEATTALGTIDACKAT